jgi:serine/threonine protein kinase
MPISRLRAALDFHDVYEKGRELHSGTASKIYECYPRQSRQEFAVKIVDRKETSRKSVTGKTTAESVLHEVAILDSLKHRNIIQIIDFFEDDDHFYLVMERMRGGDVFDRITQKKKYTEKDARDLAKVLLDTVAYLHENNIAHRDLKPQCLLLKSKKNDADIKISDFSFACRVHTPQSLTTRCGTPTYVAPEVLKNIPYDQSADMWSIGVILYVLLCGYPPFVDEIQSELFRKVRTAEWQFSGPEWEQVSEDAKNLIRRLLVANPKQRLTAKQALTCKWFCDDEKSLETHELLQSKETLKKRKSRLRSVAKALMFSNGKSDQKLGLSATETLLKRPEESEEERKSKSASRTLHKITRLEI